MTPPTTLGGNRQPPIALALGCEAHLEKAFVITHPSCHAPAIDGAIRGGPWGLVVGGAAPESVEDPRDAAVQTSPPPPPSTISKASWVSRTPTGKVGGDRVEGTLSAARPS